MPTSLTKTFAPLSVRPLGQPDKRGGKPSPALRPRLSLDTPVRACPPFRYEVAEGAEDWSSCARSQLPHLRETGTRFAAVFATASGAARPALKQRTRLTLGTLA